MGRAAPFVGRQAERTELRQAVTDARDGAGTVVLVCGEAGVGKTRLGDELAADAGVRAVHGGAVAGAPVPYGPVAAALRALRRACPDRVDPGPLRPHLAILLPELGTPAAHTDPATLAEAVRAVLAAPAADAPLLVVLDDLQWSDAATLELIAALARPIAELPVLLLALHRTDGLGRDHPLRRMRDELRRSGAASELALGPLDEPQTAALLAGTLGAPPSPALAGLVWERTRGVPFFAHELALALKACGRLRDGPTGLELDAGADAAAVPLPDAVRDAALLTVAALDDDARAAAEVAAVLGRDLDPGLLAQLAGPSAVDALLEAGLLVAPASGRVRFRHALVRDALYADVPWLRRRELHRRAAIALEHDDAAPAAVAEHWRGAGEPGRARAAFAEAAAASAAAHAHRDAMQAGRAALELWPSADDPDGRAALLRDQAVSAEHAGNLAEAQRAWRELAAAADPENVPDLQRRLARVCELAGDQEAAFAARRRAVELLDAQGRPDAAAAERLAMANHRRLGGRFAEAADVAAHAVADAKAAGRADLQARALGLLGLARVKGSASADGVADIHEGLELALAQDLTPVAAELYQRLSVAVYDSADYRRAQEALDTALGLCRAGEDGDTEVACMSCLVYVLRERGEWSRAEQLGRRLIAQGRAVWVAEGLVGAIQAFQGHTTAARRLLTSAHAAAVDADHYNMTMDTTTALGQVAAAEGAHDEALARCAALLERWRASDDHHYAVWGVRWAATHLAGRGDRGGLDACTEALGAMAAAAGHGDALAALSQAIGEAALLDGDATVAAAQLERAVELHRSLDIPHERAQVELRAGAALAAAGERERAIERLCNAYRTARRLGARPLAGAAARAVADLGDSVAARLGPRAAAAADPVGLTRRERDVLARVAVGRTNREIAEELFLSPRTIDMHVRNLLRKLDCRSRVEVAHRAAELGLIERDR